MQLKDFAKPLPDKRRKTVVVPIASDPDSIRCIAKALEKKIANFILIGEEQKIRGVAARQGVDISGAVFVAETDEQKACCKAAELVRDGKAQVLMKGLVQSSSFIGAILNNEYGLIPPGMLISCVAVFEIPAYHKLLLITDPGVNINPSFENKVRILQNAVALAVKMGIPCPKVACVSAVEKTTPKMHSTVEAQQLKEMGQKGFFGTAQVEGPFGFDVAISGKAAGIKGVTFHDLRGISHFHGIAPEDLNRHRPLFFRVLRKLQRAIDPAHQPFGADHLGDHQPAATLPLHEAAKGAGTAK